jgi:hypothetical protein
VLSQLPRLPRARTLVAAAEGLPEAGEAAAVAAAGDNYASRFTFHDSRSLRIVGEAIEFARPLYEKLIDSSWEFKVSGTENTFASLRDLFESTKSIVDDIEKRYSGMTVDEIMRYKDLWEKQVYSPAFIGASVGFMDGFIHDVSREFEEEDLAEIRETIEYMKEHGKEFSSVTAKKAALIGMTLCQFLLLIDYFNKGIKAGTIAQDTGTLLIVSFYFSLLYAICEVMKKE